MFPEECWRILLIDYQSIFQTNNKKKTKRSSERKFRGISEVENSKKNDRAIAEAFLHKLKFSKVLPQKVFFFSKKCHGSFQKCLTELLKETLKIFTKGIPNSSFETVFIRIAKKLIKIMQKILKNYFGISKEITEETFKEIPSGIAAWISKVLIEKKKSEDTTKKKLA